MFRPRIKGDYEVLSKLIQYPHKVRYWNKIQGCGLSYNEFDKFKPDCSRRTFNHRRNEFLKLKIIKLLKSRGKKPKYYSITPLGTAYCFQNHPIEPNNCKRIIKIITKYAGHRWVPIVWHETSHINKENMNSVLDELLMKLLKKISKLTAETEPKKLSGALGQTLMDVKIKKNINPPEIFLTQTLPDGSNFVISKFTLKDDKMNLNFTHFDRSKSKDFDDEEFFEFVSRHILYAFLFNLYKYHKFNFDSELKNLVEQYSSLMSISFMALFTPYK